MNSLKVLVFILVFRDGYSLFSERSSVTSIVNSASNLSLSTFRNTLSITKHELNYINDQIKKINSKVNVTRILNSLNLTVSNGLLDLKNFDPNTNSTDHHVNIADVFDLLGVKMSDGVLDLKRLVLKLANMNVTDINFRSKKSEIEDLDFVALAEKNNLPVKAYTVITEDGYILKVFRIKGNGPPVLESHGILDTSDSYILREKTSLVYILAQNGFDVWVMNYRGNRYSRNHTTLDPDTDESYWNFSMQEKGYYDLSAVIDFILEQTGRDQLSVIGHSEGTAAVFVLTSTKPEYNKKIRLFIALSPVCYLSYSGIALKAGVKVWPILNKFLKATGIQEVLGYNSLSTKLVRRLCLQGTVGYDLCYRIVFSAVLGYSPYNLDQDFFPKFLGHYLAGGSRKEIDHYVQIGHSDVFRKYDYGSKNIEVYGSKTAPSYNLKNVTCNVSLVVGKNDKIFGPKGAKRLEGELPNVVDSFLVKYDRFNHADFLVGRNAHIYLYPHIIELLISYT